MNTTYNKSYSDGQNWILDCHLNIEHLNTGQVKFHFSDVSVIQMFVIQIRDVIKIIISYFVQVTLVLGVRRNVFRATKKVTYHETAQKEEAR